MSRDDHQAIRQAVGPANRPTGPTVKVAGRFFELRSESSGRDSPLDSLLEDSQATTAD